MRRPVNIEGREPGVNTFKKISFLFAPRVFEASIKIGSIESTPEMVLRIIGKKQPRKIIKTADLNPIPNQRIARGIQAKGGTGRMISINGVIASRRDFDQPVIIPRGIANIAARRNPMNTR
jgi:hypothetical protein